MMEVGQVVRHPRYGRGQIHAVRKAGYEIMVDFDCQLRLWLRADQVRSSAAIPDQPQNSALVKSGEIIDRIMGRAQEGKKKIQRTLPPARVNPLNDHPEYRDIRLAFEAFRLGIVPEHSIMEWTVGRREELSRVLGWLDDAASGSLVVEGPYGSGKSHTLAVLKVQALERGWAVCNVGIDPSDAPAGFPKRVYRHAITSLRVPVDGEILGLEQILERLCGRNDESIRDHTIWSVISDLWRNRPKLRPAVLAYLRGRPIRRKLPGLPNLPDHTTSANVYCYLLSGLSVWLTEALGMKGMILLIDEAEMSRTYRYRYEWQRGVNFFNGLAWVADDDDVLENEVVERLDCYRGERSGLVYSGFVKVPYIYQIPCRFKVVFAFTPGYTRFFQHVHTDNLVRLDTPTRAEVLHLFDRLLDAYKKVCPIGPVQPDLRQAAETLIATHGHSFRYLIKGFMELLDHRRFYPESHPDNLLMYAGGTF